MTTGIYAITCVPTGQQYIGASSNIEQRWQEHISILIQNKHHSYLLQDAWCQYGKDNFTFTILEIVSHEKKLARREQYYFERRFKQTMSNGLNIMKTSGYRYDKRFCKNGHEMAGNNIYITIKGKKCCKCREIEKRQREKEKLQLQQENILKDLHITDVIVMFVNHQELRYSKIPSRSGFEYYNEALSLFSQWLEVKGYSTLVAHINHRRFQSFFMNISCARKWSETTKRSWMGKYRVFFDWCVGEGFIKKSPVSKL